MQLEVRHISINGKLIVTIVIVLAVIGAAIFGWSFYQKSRTLPVYHNSKYNYSLNYPRSWVLNVSNAEKDFDKGVGGQLMLSNYQNAEEQLKSKNAPIDLVAIRIGIYKISASTTLGVLARSKADALMRDKINFLIQPASLAGIEAKQFIYQEPDSQNNMMTVKTFFKRGTDMFVFTCNYIRKDSSYQGRYKLSAEAAAAQNTILNSFKLK